MWYLYVIIGFLVLFLIVALYAIRNLLLKVERLEDETISYISFFNTLNDKLSSAYERITVIDRLGAFQADDEVGTIFTVIKETMKYIVNFINENSKLDEQPKTKEK